MLVYTAGMSVKLMQFIVLNQTRYSNFTSIFTIFYQLKSPTTSTLL